MDDDNVNQERDRAIRILKFAMGELERIDGNQPKFLVQTIAKFKEDTNAILSSAHTSAHVYPQSNTVSDMDRYLAKAATYVFNHKK